ncbi:ABC transporter permease [Marinimicrococcus flavescens]|uniref:ABC transporter permease n=1 Tax=Marinimicrococcus flavescens TaxID=3031815 RepID=A0AAP4D6A0_9PROT|nr:ABC transporter permease [Marinimicrococcus flavescens]
MSATGIESLAARRAGRPDANAPELAADERRERLHLFGLSLPALLVIGIVAFLPTAWLFWLSFIDEGSFSLAHYERMVREASYLRIFWSTFEISAVVTVIAILLGYPLAYLLSQLSERAASLLLILVLVPFWTSLLVRTYAWLVLLQRRGVINDWLQGLGLVDAPLRLVHNYTGTLIGMTHIMLPFLILPTYAALRTIDRDYLKAAASLGASPLRAFWTVFFPLSLPGLMAGALLVFVLCLGFYVTPALLGGGRVLLVSMKIQQNAGMYFEWGAASAMGVILLVATLGIFWGLGRLVSLDRVMGER